MRNHNQIVLYQFTFIFFCPLCAVQRPEQTAEHPRCDPFPIILARDVKVCAGCRPPSQEGCPMRSPACSRRHCGRSWLSTCIYRIATGLFFPIARVGHQILHYHTDPTRTTGHCRLRPPGFRRPTPVWLLAGAKSSAAWILHSPCLMRSAGKTP